VLLSQDFVAPPEGYHLLGLNVSAERQLRRLKLTTFIRVENLGNVKYRDYLNRQRYFADDLGFNLIAGMNINF
jgi:iron complex outermembrane receptor protein